MAVNAFHAVTGRPMRLGQVIVFDGEHHSGVYGRVMEKLPLVQEIYACPENFCDRELEHHLSVALRELGGLCHERWIRKICQHLQTSGCR